MENSVLEWDSRVRMSYPRERVEKEQLTTEATEFTEQRNKTAEDAEVAE